MAGDENTGFGGEPIEYKFDPDANTGAGFSLDAIAISPDFGGSSGDTGAGTDGNTTGGIGSGNSGTGNGTGKRRGRPPGSGNRGTGTGSKRVSSKASLEGVSRLLQIVSVGVANVTRLPEIKLDDTDSKSLAEVWTNLAEQYGYKPDPKIEALFAAVVVTGQIAFAKYILIRMRMSLEAKSEPKAEDFVDMSNVHFVNGGFAATPQ